METTKEITKTILSSIPGTKCTSGVKSTKDIESKEIVKKTKLTEPVQIPKTCAESSKYIDFVTDNIGARSRAHFTIKNEDIEIYDKSGEIISNIDSFIPNVDHEDISKLIAPFVQNYHINFSSKYACLEGDIGNPILYVFLMPFVSASNYYIIKVGYTKNLIQRYGELKKDFGVDEIYLIYAKQISGEHIELNIHKNLKNNFSSNIYRMKKMKKSKKNEKEPLSEETYQYTWALFQNVLNIIYRTYIMNNKITLLNKEIESKMVDVRIKELENEKIKMELEFEFKIKKLDEDSQIEKLKIQYEMRKLEYEMRKLELGK